MYHSWQIRVECVEGFSFVFLLTHFAILLHHKDQELVTLVYSVARVQVDLF